MLLEISDGWAGGLARSDDTALSQRVDDGCECGVTGMAGSSGE
jgi:hypothetical protein